MEEDEIEERVQMDREIQDDLYKPMSRKIEDRSMDIGPMMDDYSKGILMYILQIAFVGFTLLAIVILGILAFNQFTNLSFFISRFRTLLITTGTLPFDDVRISQAGSYYLNGQKAISFNAAHGGLQFGDFGGAFGGITMHQANAQFQFQLGVSTPNPVPGVVGTLVVDTTGGFGVVRGSNFLSYNGFYVISDRREKKNITECNSDDSVKRLNSVRVKNYLFRGSYKKSTGCKNCHNVRTGFIAQEFQVVYPDAIHEQDNFDKKETRLTVDLDVVIPDLVGGFQFLFNKTKNQEKTIIELNNKLDRLEARFNALLLTLHL
jgi:hypothetical protein